MIRVLRETKETPTEIQDRVARAPLWATEDRETANYGPFINRGGGGDVPWDKQVTIRIYVERPRY